MLERLLEILRYNDLLKGDITFLLMGASNRVDSRINVLIFVKGEKKPYLMAKFCYDQTDEKGLFREYKILNFLHNRSQNIRSTIPQPVLFENYEGRNILVMTALDGKIMKPVESRYSEDLKTAISWLIEFNTQIGRKNFEHFLNYVKKNILFFDSTYKLSRVEEQHLMEVYKIFKSSLRNNRSNRITLNHGDFQHSNILVRNNKIVGVVDWQFANWGLPITDLWHFIIQYKLAFTSRLGDTIRSLLRENHSIDTISNFCDETKVRCDLIKPSLMLYAICLANKEFKNITYEVKRGYPIDNYEENKRLYLNLAKAVLRD